MALSVDTPTDPFATLRDYLDRVERIAESTLSGIPSELRDDVLCGAIRMQFAREAVRQMAEILR
jgi:hypothetical protein